MPISGGDAANSNDRMSTFSGKIQEILYISVDRFEEESYDSEAYFLSHCHTDHMKGLYLNTFQKQLVENNKYLYASQVSCAILKKKYPYIENNLKELLLNIPVTIASRNKTFSITLIPAGHCPGSVMFLFENDVRILYTGDYRINKNDIKKFRIFYDPFGKVKVIDKIYLDTTFFLKKYWKFPKREESLEEIIKTIKEWTDKGKTYNVNLLTSATYGYEYVFNEIYKKLDMQVHVGYDLFGFYSLIPEMDKAVTLDSTFTQIHSSCYSFGKTCLNYGDEMVKRIKVSALRWTQDNLMQGMSEFDFGTHYICYSTHSSCEEGLELIRFLKPREIEACVEYDDPHINKEMMDLIEETINEYRTDFKEVQGFSLKLFEVGNEKKRKIRKISSVSDLLNSPPRENKFEEKITVRASTSFESCSKFDDSKKQFDEDDPENIFDDAKNQFHEDDPENILYNLIHSKPKIVENTSESMTLQNEPKCDESHVLTDIINK